MNKIKVEVTQTIFEYIAIISFVIFAGVILHYLKIENDRIISFFIGATYIGLIANIIIIAEKFLEFEKVIKK